MKVTPKNVFILENGKYKEITYNELQKLEQTEKSYTSKRFLPLQRDAYGSNGRNL